MAQAVFAKHWAFLLNDNKKGSATEESIAMQAQIILNALLTKLRRFGKFQG